MVEWLDEVFMGTIVAALCAAGIVRLTASTEQPKPIPVRVRSRRRITRR